jgi:dihydroflavonol-4-reductase
MDSRPILVTGATGLVGNNVVRRLLADGAAVRVLVRSTSAKREFEGLDIDVMQGDITDAASLGRACEGVSAVVHSAGYVQLGRTQLDIHRAINVEGTRNVVAAAQAVGAKLVHVSSCDALGVRTATEAADEETEPDGQLRVPYAITKREAELVVLDAVARGLNATIVNPGFMLGPWDWKPSSGRMLLEVSRGRGMFAPRGYFSVCDVRDVADGIVAALERGKAGRRYILAGTTMRYVDAWRLFADVTGARKPLMAIGPLIAKVAGWTGDAIGRVRGHEVDVNSGALALAALPKNYSIARAQAELGYRHRPVRESAEAAWEWFKEYGYAGNRRQETGGTASLP